MAAPLSAGPDAMDSEKVNILVVDDLPDKRLAFQVVLEELGQNVVMAASGAQALRELLEREFAVILLDVNMPDIDGIETAELIRNHKKTAHIPIIFVTAYADEMQTARGYQLGAVDYILSPIVPEILRSKVRVFVDLYRAQQRAGNLARSEAERAAAEEARRRSQFLAHASAQLGESLDLYEGAARLLSMLAPRFAPFALVQLRLDSERPTLACSGEPASTTPLPSAHALPATLAALMERAAREGMGGELWIQPGALLPATVRYVEVVPMRGAGQAVAVLALGHAAPPRSRSFADQAVLDELISRAAMAFENGRLYWNLKREMARSKQAEEKLQQINRRKDEFLAMLSHELRNPLAPIRNAAEVMRRSAADAGVAWGCQVIERQVGHLSQLVDDLLDVSRITQGKIALRKEPLELGKVIQQAVETARELIDAKRHVLVAQLPDAPIWLHGDFARLTQVIGNLLSNSAKYTPAGGRIELSAVAEHGEAVISVRDNGIGIDPELLPHIFDPFTQGERSLDRSQGGLGIGLTVVQRLVALHQGRIEVQTEGPGRGALFRVALPCVNAVPRAAEEPPATSRAGLRAPMRVLVVDDNKDAAESIAVFLRLDGHDVKTVGDGPQALALAKSFDPKVAIVDIGLPGMSGYEVTSALRGSPAGGAMLLIALTGYGQQEDRSRSQAAGFDHHFVKPADPRLIQAVIDEWASPERAAVSHAPDAA